MSTLGLLKVVGHDGPGELVYFRAAEEEGLGRVLPVLPVLVRTLLRRLQLPVRNPAPGDEVEDFLHQLLNRYPRHLHLAQIRMGVETSRCKVDCRVRHAPITAPALHHLQEGRGVGAAIVNELLP